MMKIIIIVTKILNIVNPILEVLLFASECLFLPLAVKSLWSCD